MLTKIDVVNDEFTLQLVDIFKDKDVNQKIREMSTLLGIPGNRILPVKNYNFERELDENVSMLAAKALQQILVSTLDVIETDVDSHSPELSPAQDGVVPDEVSGTKP